jgi:hypothetical protein
MGRRQRASFPSRRITHPAAAGQSRNQFLGPAAAIDKVKSKKDAHADTKTTKETRLRESFVLFMPSW